MPHKFVDHTHATALLSLIDQPDGEKRARDVYGGRSASCPTGGRASVSPRLLPTCSTPIRRSMGLILHKHGIFTFGDGRARSLRAHDRDGDARGRRACKPTASRCSSRRKLPQQIAPPAEIAPTPPRRRAAVPMTARPKARGGGRCWNFAAATRAQFRQRQGRRALRQRRRHHARPHHPHQGLAADRCRAPVDGKLDDFKRAAMRGGRALRGALHAPTSSATMRASAAPRRWAIPCPASRWCRGSACSGSAHQAGRASIAADLAENAVEVHHRRRGDRHVSSRSPKPTCSIANTGRWSAPSSAPRSACRSPARSPSITGAGGTIGAATAKAFAAAGAEVALLDIDAAGRDRNKPRPSAATRWP